MWSIDNNGCRKCPKFKDCQDVRDIHMAINALNLGDADGNVGSRAGLLILACQEPSFIEQEKQEALKEK